MAREKHPEVLTTFVGVLVTLCAWSWILSLAGIAGLQAECEANGGAANAAGALGIRGFSASRLGCDGVFRYYWMIVALQMALLCSLALCIIAGHAPVTRASWVGCLAVMSVLYIQMTDSFLALESVGAYQSGQALHRVRTMGAGCIWTSICNLLLIIMVGCDFDSCGDDSPAAEQPQRPAVDAYAA